MTLMCERLSLFDLAELEDERGAQRHEDERERHDRRDEQMPVPSGVITIQTARKRRSDAPVKVVRGHALDRQHLREGELGDGRNDRLRDAMARDRAIVERARVRVSHAQ